MKLARLALITSVSLLPFAGGCKTFNKAKFNQGKGVDGEAILAVPFSEPRLQRWYGESENGRLAVEAFKAWVSHNAEGNFPDGEGARRVLQQVLDWPEKRITAAQWKQLTAGLGVKYVVYGEISNFSLERREKIGILEPQAEVSYWVVDVEPEKARIVHEIEGLSIDYVHGMEMEVPLTVMGADASSLASKRLLAKIGEQVGKDLYGYYSP